MAKKRKIKGGKVEEEPLFEIPEFDEEEFRKKEVRDAKITLVTMFYAFLFAMMCYSIGLGNPGAAVIVGIIGGPISLRVVHGLAGFDPDSMEVKQIVGFSLLFVFTMLAVWTIMVNAPASDFAEPNIDSIQVRVLDQGEYEKRTGSINKTDYVRIYADVNDNDPKPHVVIRIYRDDDFQEEALMTEDGGWYYHGFKSGELQAGTYRFIVIAEDPAGNTARKELREVIVTSN